MSNVIKEVPIWEKFNLTISEASKYFNLGEKKMRYLADNYNDYGFVLQNGTKIFFNKSFSQVLINLV